MYACAPRGQRAYGYAPRNHTRNTTSVAALTPGGIQDSMAVEGAMDAAAFVAWLEQGLGPTPAAGQIVVLDNLHVHKGERAREVIEGYGCHLLSLPAYSPDPNPIEGMFSKVKQALRRAGKRTQGRVDRGDRGGAGHRDGAGRGGVVHPPRLPTRTGSVSVKAALSERDEPLAVCHMDAIWTHSLRIGWYREGSGCVLCEAD